MRRDDMGVDVVVREVIGHVFAVRVRHVVVLQAPCRRFLIFSVEG